MKADDLTLQVLAFDPTLLLYGLHRAGKIQPYSRRQSISVDDVLPAQPAGLCACGCGRAVQLPRREWAADDCRWFGYAVQGILLGDLVVIKKYLMQQRKHQGLRPHACAKCSSTSSALEVDHILAVKLGGGGRWLDNYQLLCTACHLTKTADDRRLMSEARRAKQAAVPAVSPVAAAAPVAVSNPAGDLYLYIGDRLAQLLHPQLCGRHCRAVRRPDGRCIRGSNRNQLVTFDGVPVVVPGRFLRRQPFTLF